MSEREEKIQKKEKERVRRRYFHNIIEGM